MIDHPEEVLLVVVGAGASYDCLQDDRPDTTNVDPGLPGLHHRQWGDVRPPLTQDLVAPNAIVRELATRYPATRPLIDQLRQRLGVIPGPSPAPAATLEEALRDYLELRASNPHAARHLAAFRFLLRDYLWLSTDFTLSKEFTGGFTNHTRLVRIAYEWAAANRSHVCFVSFNYDTLLDQACADYWGLDLENLASYTSDDHGSLLKPHGSIRWAWKISDGPQLGSHREAADHRIQEGEPEELTDFALVTGQVPNHVNSTGLRTADLPALALPVAGKSDFVWPPDQRDFFDGLATRVRRVLTIGWRAAEPHFVSLLEPLVMSRNRVMIVTGGPLADPDIGEIVANLGALGNRLELKRSIDGFRAALSDPTLEWLLEPVAWPTP